MSKYKLIAFDMDGTLLNSNKEILPGTLKAIEKAFDNQNADFSLMLENYPERIKIDSVLQKAMIDVDEKGTEAAAATVAVLTKTALSVDEEVIEFRADKPFTYYILDDSGNVYFAGRYVKAE